MVISATSFYGNSIPRPYYFKGEAVEGRRVTGGLLNKEVLFEWALEAPWQNGGLLKGRSSRKDEFGTFQNVENSGASGLQREKMATFLKEGMVTSHALNIGAVKQLAKDRKRRARDHLAPKKPKTAYQFYSQEQKKLGIATDQIKAEWKVLKNTEKQKYTQYAQEDEVRFYDATEALKKRRGLANDSKKVEGEVEDKGAKASVTKQPKKSEKTKQGSGLSKSEKRAERPTVKSTLKPKKTIAKQAKNKTVKSSEKTKKVNTDRKRRTGSASDVIASSKVIQQLEKAVATLLPAPVVAHVQVAAVAPASGPGKSGSPATSEIVDKTPITSPLRSSKRKVRAVAEDEEEIVSSKRQQVAEPSIPAIRKSIRTLRTMSKK